ncbi:MAG TPA: arylesterase [Chitinophagaceae bacterium]|jgi:acyl-CoA thioesterase-1
MEINFMQAKNLIGLLFVIFLVASCRNNKKPNDLSVQDSVKEKKTSVPGSLKNIIFFGNSLTAGYGVEGSEAFPALIQEKIDSLKLPYKVINAGVSGETTAGGKSRIDWVLRQPVDVFVLELGANDGLRGIPLSETLKNLQAIIDDVKKKYPSAKIILAGMEIPPNMGKRYTDDFRVLYRQLAEKNQTLLIPFLLQGVGGEPELNQADGIHPNVKGHRIVADNVWAVLKDAL